jgi:hypothetical protein
MNLKKFKENKLIETYLNTLMMFNLLRVTYLQK